MFSFITRQEGRPSEESLRKMKDFSIEQILIKYADAGVKALSSATPMDTGKTAASWGYEIESSKDGHVIHWINDNVNNGVNIAIILQYGHGTGTGGYVQGRDYINPAIAPIFEQIANDAWNEVTNG